MVHKYLYCSIIFLMALVGCNNKNTQSGNLTINANDTITVNVESMSDNSTVYLLVGTYTFGESEGIYVYQFDTISASSQFKSSVKLDNPSYLAVSKDERYVYAVIENNSNTAAANALSFDKKHGELKLLNSQLTGGTDPCYIAVDESQKHVITANYSGGNMTLFKVEEDGSLDVASQVINFSGKGINAERQDAPHIHCVKFSPDGRFLFANDLGTDMIYKFNVNNDSVNYLTSGSPAHYKVADGSGPRHIDFHPNGKYAYLINELSGTVTAFNYNKENGDLTAFQTIQADTLKAAGSADIHVSPDGRFLYTSHRLKGDGIAIFSVNQSDGSLKKVGYQETSKHPRNFVITPNGEYMLVACRDDNVIQVFSINRESGLLENTFKDIEVDMPVCLKFVSAR